MTNVMRYNASTERGPSPIIFKDLGKIRTDQDMGLCAFIFDDFLAPTNHAASSASGGYFTYQDTGVTITGQATANDLSKEVGVLQIAGNDADNDEGHIQFGHGNQIAIGNSSTSNGDVLFETRVKVESVADDGVSLAVGLVGGPVAANLLDDNTGEIANTTSFIGFRSLAADGDKMSAVYQAAADSAVTVVQANAVTLVANTYVKLGFAFRQSASDSKKITFYVDGVEAGTVTTTQIDAATFPEDEGMAPAILTKVGTAAEVTVEVDYVAAAAYMSDR